MFQVLVVNVTPSSLAPGAGVRSGVWTHRPESCWFSVIENRVEKASKQSHVVMRVVSALKRSFHKGHVILETGLTQGFLSFYPPFCTKIIYTFWAHFLSMSCCIFMYVCLPDNLPACLHVCLPTCLPDCIKVHLLVYLSVCQACLSVCLYTYLSVCWKPLILFPKESYMNIQ